MRRTAWFWLALLFSTAALLCAAELLLRQRYRHKVLPAEVAEPGLVTLVVLGDSIAAGAPGPPAGAWPALLAERLQAGYPSAAWQVVNAGVPGDTAPLGLARFDRDVAGHGPQAVLIGFGLNDCNPARYGLDLWLEKQAPAGLGRSFAWRAVQVRAQRWMERIGRLSQPAVEEVPQPFPRTSRKGFRDALAALVDRTKAIGAVPVLLTMTPLGPTGAAAARTRELFYADYDTVIRDLSSERRLLLVSLASGMPADGFDLDGLHLSPEGQEWVADQVYHQLEDSGFWADMAHKPPR